MEVNYKKKYEEALEWVRELYPTMVSCADKEAALRHFPELAESDDERIRKELVQFFKEKDEEDFEEWVPKAKVLAWFEKQGEHEPVVIIPKFRVGGVIRPKGSTAECTIESISGECYHGKGWGLHIGYEEDYELVEQKSSWSEEDEMIRETLKLIVKCAYDKYGIQGKEIGEEKLLAWLEKQVKKLKG